MKTIINISGNLSEVRRHLEFDSDDELLYTFCEDKMIDEHAVIHLNSSANKAFIAWDNNGIQEKSYLRVWPVQKNNYVKQ